MPPATAEGNKTPRKKTATLTMRRIALRTLEMGENAKKLIGSVMTSTSERRLRLQRTRSGGALTTEPEILPAMLSMWKERSIFDLPVSKDLPRLVRRIVVFDENDDILYDSPTATMDEDTSLKRSIELTKELILTLIDNLEGKTRAEELRPKLESIVETASEKSDGEELVKEMIELLGTEEESCTVRALKTVHQDIVGHCTFQLKQHITSRFMTKDVRTPEGWRITLRITPDQFQISHIRREQSIDQGGDKTNHWEFEWELRLLFDSKVVDMRVAQLRVTDLFLSQTIDPQLEEDIKHDLLGGEIS